MLHRFGGDTATGYFLTSNLALYSRWVYCTGDAERIESILSTYHALNLAGGNVAQMVPK